MLSVPGWIYFRVHERRQSDADPHTAAHADCAAVQSYIMSLLRLLRAAALLPLDLMETDAFLKRASVPFGSG